MASAATPRETRGRRSEDEWDAYTRGVRHAAGGVLGLRRNVAIDLGNWLAQADTTNPEAVGELVAALSDEDPAVAEAAAWGLGRARLRGQPDGSGSGALGQTGSAEALQALRGSLPDEETGAVRDEIERALDE